MTDRLHVAVPFSRLGENLSYLLENRLQPEIGFTGPDLDQVEFGLLQETGEKFKERNLAVSIHAPFNDLNPGSLDPRIFDATRIRFEEALEAARFLGARVAVFHPGFDRWKYGGQNHLWVERSLELWPDLIKRAGEIGCKIGLENIFEEAPDLLLELLQKLDSPWMGHCFDVGHWHLFSRADLEEWFAALGPYLVHAHVHDNFGRRDDHLPVGEGVIRFDSFFRRFKDLPVKPTITLEAFDRDSLSRSVLAIAPFLSD